MKKFSAKTVVIIAIGAALYGIGGLLSIPIFAGTALRPAVAILAVFAALYGPVVGFIVGFLGHLITDLFGGWGVWLTWVLGSGLVGIIEGFYGRITSNRLNRGEFPGKDIGIFIVLGMVANFVGYSIAAILDFFVFAEPIDKLIVQQLLSASSNTVMIAIIGTIILLIVAKRSKQGTNLSEEK